MAKTFKTSKVFKNLSNSSLVAYKHYLLPNLSNVITALKDFDIKSIASLVKITCPTKTYKKYQYFTRTYTTLTRRRLSLFFKKSIVTSKLLTTFLSYNK